MCFFPNAGSTGGYSGSAMEVEVTDPDLEKISIDLTKLSAKVHALIFAVGMHAEEEVTPELDVAMRILDQTKAIDTASIGSGFVAAHFGVLSEEGHSALVLGALARVPETGTGCLFICLFAPLIGVHWDRQMAAHAARAVLRRY